MPIDYSINMMPWMSSGAYGSYDNYMPSSMMGMSSGMNGMQGLGGYGMGGYMNMMMQYQLMMQKMQEQAEIAQANHSADMHSTITNNEVKAHKERMDANFTKLGHDGEIQDGIDKLYRKVKSGDQIGVCQEFDKLVDIVYKRYGDELKAESSETMSPRAIARHLIEEQYAAQINYVYGGEHDLESDIRKYGDGAFKNGFLQSFKRGHHDMYVDQTIDHVYGERIDEKGEKEFSKKAGKVSGIFARGCKDAVYGGIAGATLYTLGGGTISVTKKAFGGNLIKFNPKALCRLGIVGAALAIAGDLVWGLSQ